MFSESNQYIWKKYTKSPKKNMFLPKASSIFPFHGIEAKLRLKRKQPSAVLAFHGKMPSY